MNQKVARMLNALAIVLKDERQSLINAVHEVVNDKRDGYDFDFKAAAENMRHFVKGKCYE